MLRTHVDQMAIRWESLLRFEGFWRLLDYGSVREAGKVVSQPSYTMPYPAPEVCIVLTLLTGLIRKVTPS